MAVKKEVTVEASDGKLTLAELREFVDELSTAADPVNVVIKARVNMGGTVKSITAAGS